MAHIGVANRTEEPQTLTYDGKGIAFAPKGQKGSVRIIADVPLSHIESRQHIQHKKWIRKVDGEDVVEHLPQMQGVKVFDIIPVEEALKRGAAVDEDPQVVALREQKAAKDKEKAELFAEFEKHMLDKGWTPPEAAEDPEPAKGKGKGGK